MNTQRLSDDDLRTAWENAADSVTVSAQEATDHPSPEKIWAAAHGELGPSETRDLVDHVALCAECAESWRLARHLGEEASATVTAPKLVERTATRRATTGRQWWLAAVAAALVATVGIGLRDVWMPSGDAIFRGGETATVKPRVPDGATLPRDRFELAWEPVEGAIEYDLRLTTAGLRPLDTRRGLDVPRHRVPLERLAALDDGSRLFWQVEVVLEGGDRHVSPSFEVVLGPVQSRADDAAPRGADVEPGAGRSPP